MVSNTFSAGISDQMLKLKQKQSQTSYLTFSLGSTVYAINLQNVVNIIEQANLIYLSHMSPPIVGMHYYNNLFVPILDFGGYRPHSKDAKLLILSTNTFKKDQNFGLSIDRIDKLSYFKDNELLQNQYPFNNLLPSYYYAHSKNKTVNFIDVQDLANQIEA